MKPPGFDTRIESSEEEIRRAITAEQVMYPAAFLVGELPPHAARVFGTGPRRIESSEEEIRRAITAEQVPRRAASVRNSPRHNQDRVQRAMPIARRTRSSTLRALALAWMAPAASSTSMRAGSAISSS